MSYKHLISPPYIKFEEIHGSTLNKILKNSDWRNELRKIYKLDPNLFFDIRDELILRGFKFEYSIHNNFFPKIEFETLNYLKVSKDNQNFRKLNNDVTGISNIIRRYNISSDLFFNYISIEGISHIVKKDHKFIINCFKEADFNVVNVKANTKDPSFDSNIKSDSERYGLELFNLTSNPVPETRYDKQNLKGNSDYETIINTPIEKLFTGNKFNLFIKFCLGNNIKFFSDINLDIINKFSGQSGVGIKKSSDVNQRYEELILEIKNQKDVSSIYSLEYLSTLDDNIEYFCNNDLKLILETNNISYLQFIDNMYSKENYSSINKKIEEFHKKLPHLKENARLKLEQKRIYAQKKRILLSPVYEELMHFQWSSLSKILRIECEDIDDKAHLYEILENEEWMFIYEKLLIRMNSYKPIKNAILEISEVLSDREVLTLKLRSQNQTLEQIGKIHKVTRERVRQIEKKAVNKIYDKLKNLYVDEYIRKFLLQKELVSVESIVLDITKDEKSRFIIHYYISNHNDFELNENIVLDVKLNSYILETVSDYFVDSKPIILVDELYNRLNENTKFEVTMEKLDFTMKNISYRRKNNIYIHKSVRLPNLITYIFKYYLNEKPFEISDENFEKLNVIMNKTFDINFENGKRAAIARIRDTKNIILVDSNTFMYKDLDLISQELIEVIEIKLKYLLSNNDTTTATILYNKYKVHWGKYGVNSILYLYSIVQHHFKNSYQIGRGNTLSISKLNTKINNSSEILRNLLAESKNILEKSEILEKLHWPPYKLEQLINRDSEFILVELENNKYGVKLMSSYKFSESEINKLRSFTLEFITSDYLYTQDLMLEMEFDNDLSTILLEKNIYKLYDFASILKAILPELKGFHQFIYKSTSEIKVIEDAIYKEFTEILTRQELSKFIKEKGYSESSLTSIINDLQEKKYFYPYTSTSFINSGCLNITEEVLTGIKTFIENALSIQYYVSIYDLVGLDNLSKISEYPWKPNLLATIAKELGYIIIDTTRDYRYNKLLLLHSNSSIKQLDELAYKLLSEEYTGNFHEVDVAKFLKMKKLTHAPNMSLGIKTSPLFEFNEYGFIKLLGG